MAKTDTLDDRLARLERERFDVSYLEHDPRRLERQKIAAERKRTEELLARPARKKARPNPLEGVTPQQVFDAGRYAAGARDAKAIIARDAVKTVMRERKAN